MVNAVNISSSVSELHYHRLEEIREFACFLGKPTLRTKGRTSMLIFVLLFNDDTLKIESLNLQKGRKKGGGRWSLRYF